MTMDILVRFCYQGPTGGLEGLHTGPISLEFQGSSAHIVGRGFETKPIVENPGLASSWLHQVFSSLSAMGASETTSQTPPAPLRYERKYVTFDCEKEGVLHTTSRVLRLSVEEFAEMRIRVAVDAPSSSGRRMPDLMRSDGTIQQGVPFLERIANFYATVTPPSSTLGNRICVVITPDGVQLNSFFAHFEKDTTPQDGEVPFTLTI